MVEIVALNETGIARGAAVLRDGGLVAFPTETVYGLGADATNDRAVARIFEAKQRPQFNPLIAHVSTPEEAWDHVQRTPAGRALAAAFWPGPLTLVLPRRSDCRLSLLSSAGLETAAIRSPSHAGARALLAAVGRPVAAPSANRSGQLSPTTAAHVARSLGDRVDLILDGGPCPVGVESTVVDASISPPALLRPGGVTAEAIEAVLGGPLATAVPGEGLKSPGMLDSHYAPVLPLRMNATAAEPGEALLGFAGTRDATMDLSPGGDLVEAAANLFAMLHALDDSRYRAIAVARIPDSRIGRAINDRLRRAAAERPAQTAV